MESSSVQPFTFRYEDARTRSVTDSVAKFESWMLRPPRKGLGGWITLPAVGPVAPGTRVDLRLACSDSATLRISGVVRGYRPLPETLRYRVDIAIIPSHRHRFAALHTAVVANNIQRRSRLREDVRQGIGRPAPAKSSRALRRHLRADQVLLRGLRSLDERNCGGTLLIPADQGTQIGRAIVFEIAMGPSADDVELAGIVSDFGQGENGRREALVRVVPSHRHRVEYVLAVLHGLRHPTARVEPRLDLRLPARLLFDGRVMPASAQSLSSSGVFVRSHMRAPQGELVEVAIQTEANTLVRLAAEVVWHSGNADRAGFGARFRRDQTKPLSAFRSYLDRQRATPSSQAQAQV